ncbi:hypothetical protein GR925_35960 [Streptomyces sp. HUCO-GS316]|uniref:hypothetical protein n=1 Tax=Streptomyces sp. HUCO-GS316 TaxID=2692198 RepID=UPI00136A41A7|nr:hypothetical protein [Streptomyces sp. HUCO-GS316]MXM68667.1 hypothetical protein [Streptomyces sp. HUCO-GS316]
MNLDQRADGVGVFGCADPLSACSADWAGVVVCVEHHDVVAVPVEDHLLQGPRRCDGQDFQVVDGEPGGLRGVSGWVRNPETCSRSPGWISVSSVAGIRGLPVVQDQTTSSTASSVGGDDQLEPGGPRGVAGLGDGVEVAADGERLGVLDFLPWFRRVSAARVFAGRRGWN